MTALLRPNSSASALSSSSALFDPREMIADQFLDLRERILDVATIVPALGEMGLMSSDLQRLPKPIEAFAGQGKAYQKQGLGCSCSDIAELTTAKKAVSCLPHESGCISVSGGRCMCL